MISWDDRYSTGVLEIDEQHKMLFSYINILEKDICEGRIEEALGNTLVLLSVYTKKHFSFEEECMDKYKCSVAEKNKESHDQFLKTIQSFKDRVEKGEDKVHVLKDIHKTAENWLINHICKIDIHLKTCVNQN